MIMEDVITIVPTLMEATIVALMMDTHLCLIYIVKVFSVSVYQIYHQTIRY